ncbi:hypothetical protein WJX77_004250 [Trebouxia sp. C0004]
MSGRSVQRRRGYKVSSQADTTEDGERDMASLASAEEATINTPSPLSCIAAAPRRGRSVRTTQPPPLPTSVDSLNEPQDSDDQPPAFLDSSAEEEEEDAQHRVGSPSHGVWDTGWKKRKERH